MPVEAGTRERTTAQPESPRKSEESSGLTSTDRMFALDSPYCSRQECCREKADARLRINTLRRTGPRTVLPPQSQELSGTSPSGSRRLFIQVKKILSVFRRKINVEWKVPSRLQPFGLFGIRGWRILEDVGVCEKKL